MQIDDNLNLVIPAVEHLYIDKSDGKDIERVEITAYAYHTPISRDVFTANFRLLTQTIADSQKNGAQYHLIHGKTVAGLTLREVAKAEGLQAAPILAEIRRLTSILAPTANGYEPLPVDVALARDVIDDEVWGEVESAIVFFTCNYCLEKKFLRASTAKTAASILGGYITSSTPTEYCVSLKTATTVTDTPAAASSVPV